MKERDGTVYVSATDLANHLSCRHLTTVDLRLAKGEIAEPSWDNPHLRVLQQRGLEHERAYIESLRSRGLTVVDLSNGAEERERGNVGSHEKRGSGHCSGQLRERRLERPG